MLPALSAGNILINYELFLSIRRKTMSTGIQNAQKANVFLLLEIKHQFQLNGLV
jgi:hypothetical protein